MDACKDRIKEAMRIRSLKSADLVRITGMSSARISHYVTGKYLPKQDAIHSLALALNVSESWLMGLDVPMEREKEVAQPTPSDIAKVALFGGDGEVTEEMWNEVKAFAEFVKQKYKR